jgi:membrane AbrB-like protein
VPVILVSAATLALTIVAGLALARAARIDRPTASLGMVAGGASGIVAMAGDLGGDDRLVAFMQYARVLVISLLTPLLVPVAFPGAHAAATGGEGPLLGSAGGWALTIGASLAGALVATRLRVPAPVLLGPLVVAAALSLSGATGDVAVPPLVREAGFALIGLYIGLGFDREALRRIARLLVPVAVAIAGLLVACFGLAVLLTAAIDVPLLDAYLATTPGGLYAVLPIAFGSGADTTFVLAVQGLRLLAMILAAPLVVRWIVRAPART